MKKMAVIVIPVHQNFLTDYEKIALRRCVEVFRNHPIALIAPEGLEMSVYEGFGKTFEVIFFEKKYFKNVKGYSHLLTRPFFYQTFALYEYMLIYQLDVFVFRDELAEWCAKGYDYIGAPWIEGVWRQELANKWHLPFLKNWFRKVGNGGFSLRKVQTFKRTSQLFSIFTQKMKLNEDIIWSNNPLSWTPFFKIAPFALALGFAFEERPEVCWQMNHEKLPFGCHA